MKALKGFIALAVLLIAVQAHATSTLFNIYFHETRSGIVGPGDWQGTYIITNGRLTAFSALIGDCQPSPLFCFYATIAAPGSESADPGSNGNDPFSFSQDGLISPLLASSRLAYYPITREWNTGSNIAEKNQANIERFGVYRTQVAPEPSSIWLILAGLALIAGSKFRKL